LAGWERQSQNGTDDDLQSRLLLDAVLLAARNRGIEVLALDEALESLSKVDKRKYHSRSQQIMDLQSWAALGRLSDWNRSARGRLATGDKRADLKISNMFG
jgi:hypothetical protein